MNEPLVIADLKRRIEELRSELAVAVRLAKAAMVEAELEPALVQIARVNREAREQILRAVLSGALDAALLTDDEGRVVDANAAACEVFERSRAELLRSTIVELAAPGYEPPAPWEQFVAEGRMRGRLPLMRGDGSTRTLEFSAIANVVPGRHLSFLREVSERAGT